MYITLIVLAITATLFALNKVRADIVALCAVITLLLFGILTPEEALSGFSNPVVIMMAGLFIVGGGIFQTGLAKMISSRLMSLAGDSEIRLFLLVMLVTSGIGAFVSNTGTVALMLPIVVSMSASTSIDSRRLLMPLAFASSMGGMLTLIGTPPNLVIDAALQDAGYGNLSFFSFLPVGLICLAIGIVVLLPLTKCFLGNRGSKSEKNVSQNKTLKELVKEYHLAERVTRSTVVKNSPIIGKTIAELNIQQEYKLTVLEVRRQRSRQRGIIKDIAQKMATPDTKLQEGDIIYFSGPEEAAARFARENRMPLAFDTDSLDFYDIGLAEIVLLQQSMFVGKKLKESGFRSKYSINVLAIRRNNEYIRENLSEQKMMQGDVLLVQGTWQQIGRLANDEDHWVVLGQPLEEAARVTFDHKAPIAASIMLLMICMMVFDFIPVAPVTAVLLASVLMILMGCFRSVEAAYKTINWESIILIAAMMPMSVAIEKTGAAAIVSHGLVNSLGDFGPILLLAGIYLTTSLLTFFISNTATAVLMSPIAIASAQEVGVNPMAMLFAVAVAASMCFASPFSTPPNALVMKAGGYKFMDYIKVGLPLQLIIGIAMVLLLPLLFPF